MPAGLTVCALFVAFSFFAREQPENTYVLQKADRLVRTAGTPLPANSLISAREPAGRVSD